VTQARADGRPVSEKLLLNCARPRSDTNDAAVAEIAGHPQIDWPELGRLATQHNLLARTGRSLDRVGARVPADLATLFQAAYLQTMAHNLLLTAALEHVLQVLGAANVEVMALKGAAWVPSVYDDAGLRDIGDLDLLVHPDDVHQAAAAITAVGYAPGQHVEADHHHWPALVRPDGLVSVELHHHLGLPGTLLDFELDDMWARSVPTSRDGAEVVIPAAEDLLIHVALHFLGDRMFKPETGALGQLADLAALVDHLGPRLDWGQVVETGERHGIGPPLGLVLATTSQLLDVTVPAEAMTALTPDLGLVDDLVHHAVLRSPAWMALAEVSGRFPSVRQLAPPNPRRWRPTRSADRPPFALLSAYARWASAAAHVLAHPTDVRERMAFDRNLTATVEHRRHNGRQ
jgi:hypothetical protein